MRSINDLRGRAVLDVASGSKLGEVAEVVLSPDDGSVLGLTVKTGGPFDQKTLSVEAAEISSVGQNAVMVKGEVAKDLEEASPALRDAREGGRRYTGRQVVTRQGTLLGSIQDVMIDEDSLRVAKLSVGSGGMLDRSSIEIEAERVVSVGPDVIIVRQDEPTEEPAR